MDIKTYIRPNNKKIAEKILRKGRGAWGDFVNKALEEEANKSSTGSDTQYVTYTAKISGGEEYKVK